MSGNTVKLVELFVVPPAFVTLIRPVVAVAGTIASICVLETMVNNALTPLNNTSVVPVNVSPVNVIVEPMTSLVGEKLEIVGVTPKLVPLTLEPDGVVTEITPLVAPEGTVAVIDV